MGSHRKTETKISFIINKNWLRFDKIGDYFRLP